MKKNRWMLFFLRSILRRNKRRYILGILSLCVGLTTFFLLFTVKNGLTNSILPETLKRGDAYRFSLTKTTTSTSSHFLTIQQTSAPKKEELTYLKTYFPSLSIEYNFESLFPSFHTFHFANEKEGKGNFCAIRSFDEKLLIEGRTWWNENEVIINQKMKKEMQKYLQKEEIIGESIYYSTETKVYQAINDMSIKDTFQLNKQWIIVGVIEEFPLLNQSTIYYSYDFMKDFLKNHYLRFYSIALGNVYSWYEWLEDLPPTSPWKGHHVWLFLEDFQDALRMMNLFQQMTISTHYLLDSSTFQNYQTIQNLILFVKSILSCISVILIFIMAITILYLTYTHYAEDHHHIGIILSLGMDHKSIAKFYAFQAEMMGVVSFVISIGFLLLFTAVMNAVISRRFAIHRLFHFSHFGLLSIIVFFVISILLYFISFFPIYGTRKKEIDVYLKEE